MQKIVIILMCLLFSISANSQTYIGYRYLPSKQELETDISYLFKNNIGIGTIHNEEKNFFEPNKDKHTLTYLYANFPIYEGLRIQGCYGFGYRRDIEITVQYIHKNFVFEIGGSETEPFIIELIYLMNF